MHQEKPRKVSRKTKKYQEKLWNVTRNTIKVYQEKPKKLRRKTIKTK
jgi:hypothetical protein